MALSESTIILIITAGCATIGLICKLIYSSKCKLVKCCGCEIHRDVSQEQHVSINSGISKV